MHQEKSKKYFLRTLRARYEINVARFRGIFVGGQGSGTAAYSALRKATPTQSSGKKTRKMQHLFRNGPLCSVRKYHGIFEQTIFIGRGGTFG